MISAGEEPVISPGFCQQNLRHWKEIPRSLIVEKGILAAEKDEYGRVLYSLKGIILFFKRKNREDYPLLTL